VAVGRRPAWIARHFSVKRGDVWVAARERDDVEEDGKFARVDLESDEGVGGTSDEPLGPPACLLVGFPPKDAEAFRTSLCDMGGDFVNVLSCSDAALRLPLGRVMEKSPAELPLSSYVPYRKRTIFMSGMTGAEIVEVMGAYSETGMPRAVFAALVPRNAAKTVSELAEEVHEDDERLRAARGLTQ